MLAARRRRDLRSAKRAPHSRVPLAGGKIANAGRARSAPGRRRCVRFRTDATEGCAYGVQVGFRARGSLA